MKAGTDRQRFLALRIAALTAMFFFSVNAYSSAFPDTLHIKPVVIRGERSVKEGAGVIASSIDSTAMMKALTANLSDLILQNTPVFIKEYGRGAMATASFRGTAPSHTQVLWNGINLSSPMLGMVDFSTIPVYFIDNVSLLHGSGSLSENSGALGGIVKLQNTPDFMNRVSGRILSGIGSYGTQDEMIRLNLGNKKLQSQTRAFYNHSDNDYSFINKLIAGIDPTTGKYIYSRVKNEHAAYQNYGFLQELYFSPSERNLFSARYWYQNTARSLPKLLTDESANSNINRQKENAHRASVEWKNFGRGTLDIQSGLNVQNMSYLSLTRTSGAEDQRAVNSVSTTVSSYNKLTYEYHFNKTFSFSAGVNADIHQVESINAPFDSAAYGYRKSRHEEALFLSLNKSVGQNWSVTLLGRQNFIDGHPAPVIPSLGVEYYPFADRNFTIKSNIARNYHQPSLNDLYYLPGGNPDLKPEEGVMADLGSSYSRTGASTSFNLSLNGYVSKISNWIIWLPTGGRGYWVPFNMKTVDAKGFEFKAGLNGRLSSFKYRLNGNYAFTRSVNKDDPMNWADESYGKQLPFIPVHSANLSANLSRNGFHFTWIWNYYSKRYTTTSTDKDSEMDVIYPYIMNNLYIGKSFSFHKKSIDVELKVLNFFDEEYRTVLQNMMPGRNYSLLLRYDF